MTSRWDFGNKPEKQDEEQDQVEGTFYCQRDYCQEEVGEAIYLPYRKVLTWKCSSGHKSYIEDITL